LRALRIAWRAIRVLPAPIIGASLAGWSLLALDASVATSPLLCVGGSASVQDPAAYVAEAFNAAPLAGWVSGFALMLLAMMPPLLSGALSHVWQRSLRRRRVRAVVLFLAGYCAVWLVAGVPLVALSVLSGSMAARTQWQIAVVGLALATAWQATPLKQLCLNRCHRRPPLATFGLRAEADAYAYGASHGVWCVGTCWAMMLLPLAAGGGPLHLPLMLAVTVAAMAERVRAPQESRWGAALPRWPDDLRIVLAPIKTAA
jgi:predicted metal-binding membrane protein